jgi:hypothetical protein
VDARGEKAETEEGGDEKKESAKEDERAHVFPFKRDGRKRGERRWGKGCAQARERMGGNEAEKRGLAEA